MSYRTVYKEAKAMVTIKKSKFIAHVAPVSTEAEATGFVEKIKKEHREASHNVPVYLIGKKHEIQRYSDDGEPSQTAGLPVLDMLKRENITNVALVITRYYGGTKLGTGGLVRAYTSSAQAGLEAAVLIERRAYCPMHLEIDYGVHGKIQYVLEEEEGVMIADTVFSDHVAIALYCPPDQRVSLKASLASITAGQAKIEEGKEVWLAFCGGQYIAEGGKS